jgi:hypothetical protein
MIEWILFILWTMIGITSIIYWWTDKFPLLTKDIFITFLAGLVLGVFAFLFFALPVLIGWKGRNHDISEKILIAQRGTKKHHVPPWTDKYS